MRKTSTWAILLGMVASILGLMLLAAPSAQAQDNCPAPLSLPVGTEVTIIGGVYIRALPNLEAGIVEYSPDRIAAVVIGEPQCADGYIWWNVERAVGTPIFKGWVAQGTPRKQFLFANAQPPTDLPCTTPLNLVIGQAVSLFDGARLRSEPTDSGRVLTVVPVNETVRILGAPVCADGFNWWQVEAVVLGVRYNGWMAEGSPFYEGDRPDPLRFNAAPDADPATSLACGPASPLQVGATGILRFSGEPLKALRAAPTVRGELLYSLPSGVQLRILSAPFCNEGVNWREVQITAGSRAVQGWMAEGTWMGRFLGANGEDYDQPAP